MWMIDGKEEEDICHSVLRDDIMRKNNAVRSRQRRTKEMGNERLYGKNVKNVEYIELVSASLYADALSPHRPLKNICCRSEGVRPGSCCSGDQSQSRHATMATLVPALFHLSGLQPHNWQRSKTVSTTQQ